MDNDKWVCFSGTPCQIEGLKKFLSKEYDKLITVDIVCRAVPSPLVYRKYLKYQKKKLHIKKINNVIFRDKRKYGYQYSNMAIEYDENKIYRQGIETDPYLRAFFKNLSDRPSCYNCRFRKRYRRSDFTIWDCFVVEKFSRDLNDNKGTTRLLIHSDNGEEIFNKIKEKYAYKSVDVDILVTDVKEMYRSVSINNKRKEFFKDINNMSEIEFFNKYFPDTIRVKLERNIRQNLVKLGIYNKIKKLIKQILRKT